MVWNGVRWCGLVPTVINWHVCQLHALAAISLEKETTVPIKEAQRWYRWLGEQQSLLSLLRTEPQIIQPVTSRDQQLITSAVLQHHAIQYHNQ
jgi:hypothetical protein